MRFPTTLSPLARAAFVASFFGLELGGIAWGLATPDRVLAFQMFSESSRLTIHLFREVERNGTRVRVPLPNGTWHAPGHDGKLRSYSWRARVGASRLDTLGQSIHARYGLAAQLFRLQAALDDFVRHVPEDRETLALVAEVDTLKNGVAGHVQLRADKP